MKVAFDQSDGHHYRPISQNVRQYQVSRSPQPILCEGYRKPYNNYE